MTTNIDTASAIMGINSINGSGANKLFARLVALGYGSECGRCDRGFWGGGRCYDCGGTAVKLPQITDALATEARARQDAGALAAYFAAKSVTRNPGLVAVVTDLCAALAAFVESCEVDALDEMLYHAALESDARINAAIAREDAAAEMLRQMAGDKNFREVDVCLG